jgi:DNA mismatch endonuclease (patch repair protein)
MGKIDEKHRSHIMSCIKGKDTEPELFVRKIVSSLGYRYRLHSSKLPGKPDLVFPGKKKVIFIHGCFWHQHAGCKIGKPPKSNVEYWAPKLAQNVKRDRKNIAALKRLGWKALVIRECRLKDTEALASKIDGFLKTQ